MALEHGSRLGGGTRPRMLTWIGGGRAYSHKTFQRQPAE